MEVIGGGLHPAVDGESLDEDEVHVGWDGSDCRSKEWGVIG